MKNLLFICLIFISLSVTSQTVYKTPSGKKYHLSSCRMVNNVSQAISLNQVVGMGLEPCKICYPPTVSTSTSNLVSTKKAKGESSTVQCKGKTKAGTRCKHRTSIANGYCFQHNPD